MGYAGAAKVRKGTSSFSGKNSYALDAVQESFTAGAELGQHAAGNDGGLGHLGNLIDGEPSEYLAVRSLYAGDVGKEDQGVGTAGDGAGSGHFVGVNVVVLAIETESHGAEHRHGVELPYGVEQARVAGGNFADEAKVGGGALFASTEEQAIATGEPYGRLADGSERGDERFVDFAGEDHEGDVAGFSVGDAQAGDELALLAEGFEGAGELHTASVDDGNLISVADEIGDGAGAAFEQSRILQPSATEFNDKLHSWPSGSGIIRGLRLRHSRA